MPSQRVLFIDPSLTAYDNFKQVLTDNNFKYEVETNGKSGQLRCFKEKWNVVVINVDVQNNNGFEVLKFVRTRKPDLRVVLVIDSKERMKELQIDDEVILNLGINDFIVKPVKDEDLIKSLAGSLQYNMLKNQYKDSGDVTDDKGVCSLEDKLFTRVAIDIFTSGNSTICDLYIKLSSNRYIKLLKRGDYFSAKRIKRYKDEKGVEYLYFKTKDRGVYIHYLNQLAEKWIKKPGKSVVKKVKAVQLLTEKYIEEIYLEGVKPEMMEEGDKICKNVFDIISFEPKLYQLVRKFQDQHSDQFTHSYLVMMLSAMTAKAMKWNSESTIAKIAMGAMLHDIGKTKLDPLYSSLRPDQLSAAQFEIYKAHSVLGVQVVTPMKKVNTEIKQIILQHHERLDGSGYPSRLSASKIYPPAQVVGFVDTCAWIMAAMKMSPPEAIKLFLSDKMNNGYYGPEVIRGFISCLKF